MKSVSAKAVLMCLVGVVCADGPASLPHHVGGVVEVITAVFMGVWPLGWGKCPLEFSSCLRVSVFGATLVTA